jgi:cation/acetate symporter
MNGQEQSSGDARAGFGRLALGYAGCFAALVIALALMVWNGMSDRTINQALLGFILISYPAFGLLARAGGLAGYFVAGRRIAPRPNGIAAATCAMTPVFVFGTAGAFSATGYDGIAIAYEVAGGIVLAAVLIAPYLRNMSADTVADLIGARFGRFARLVAAIIVIVSSAVFLLALIGAAGVVITRLSGLNFDLAIYAALTVTVLGALLGGMPSLTAIQIAQYVTLILGYLGLELTLAAQIVAPRDLAPDRLIEGTTWLVNAVLGSWRIDGFDPGTIRAADWINPAGVMICLMLGAASLPHMLVRSLATPSVNATRESSAWSLFFLLLLSILTTVYAALSNPDAGTQVFDLMASIIAVLALAAMLSTSKSLLLTIANSLAHDIVHQLLVPKAKPGARLIVARILLLVVGGLIATAAVMQPVEIVPMTVWAFSLAAAGLFPVLVLAMWWGRATAAGAVCGMVAGFGICLLYIALTRYYPQIGVGYFAMSSLRNPADAQALVDVAKTLADPRWLADLPASADNPLASNIGWFNIKNLAAGVFGLAAGFFISFVISLIGKAPAMEAVERVRTPA